MALNKVMKMKPGVLWDIFQEKLQAKNEPDSRENVCAAGSGTGEEGLPRPVEAR